MLTWTVGTTSITSVVESETPTSPRFLYEGLTKDAVLARCEEAGWLRPNFVDDAGFLLQKIQCLLVEADDLVIAVDTCVGNDKDRANAQWHHLSGPFLDQMAEAGYPAESITHVVCTHLHVDHVGWNTRLVDGHWVPTFPNARYLFVGREYDHWEAEQAEDRARPDGDVLGDDVFGDSVAPIAAAGLADRVGADHVLSPSVRLRSTPGHTPGHVSVIVESNGARAVITGDMIHHPLQMVDVALSSKFDTDPAKARLTRSEAFADWADGETLVIGTHFGSPTAGTLHEAEGGYRLEF